MALDFVESVEENDVDSRHQTMIVLMHEDNDQFR